MHEQEGGKEEVVRVYIIYHCINEIRGVDDNVKPIILRFNCEDSLVLTLSRTSIVPCSLSEGYVGIK